MIEPRRNNKISSLIPKVQGKVNLLLKNMKESGFDPIVFEALRTPERQKWLYGIGRTHSLKRKPVTWTLRSNHLTANAVDIISKSRGWNWSEFYDDLAVEANRVGMHVISKERCHIEL